MIRGRKQSPQQTRVQIHQGIERADLLHGGQKANGVNAQHARIYGERISVGAEISEYHEVRIHFLGDVQHGGAAEFGIGWKTVAVHFVQAAIVGIDLLAGRGKLLDGEFLETLTNPIQARRGAGIFKGKDEVDAALRKIRSAARGGRNALPARQPSREKKNTREQNQTELAEPLPPLFHLLNILTDAAVAGSRFVDVLIYFKR